MSYTHTYTHTGVRPRLLRPPLLLSLSVRHQSGRICFFFNSLEVLLFMSWSTAENTNSGICSLSEQSVLAGLSYDPLVVNRSREPFTHQGQTHLTTLYLPSQELSHHWQFSKTLVILLGCILICFVHHQRRLSRLLCVRFPRVADVVETVVPARQRGHSVDFLKSLNLRQHH